MTESPHDEVEILAGTHGRLWWQVWAGGSADDLMTMLQVLDVDRRVARSGFRGPALYPDRKVKRVAWSYR